MYDAVCVASVASVVASVAYVVAYLAYDAVCVASVASDAAGVAIVALLPRPLLVDVVDAGGAGGVAAS